MACHFPRICVTCMRKTKGSPIKQIAHLLQRLASGIDYAHSQRSRSIAISNRPTFFCTARAEISLVDRPLTKNTDPILTDFGLVRIAHSGTQTASGLVSGTPKYMSPEQARGDKVDHRTDIYSLGVVLYELLAGHAPFEGENTLVVIYKHIHEPPPPIENISPPHCRKWLTGHWPRARRIAIKAPGPGCGFLRGDWHARGIGDDQSAPAPWTPRPAPASGEAEASPNCDLDRCRDFCLRLPGRAACRRPGAICSISASLAEKLYNLSLNRWHRRPGYIPVTGPDVSGPAGVLRFQNGTSAMDQITISAELAPLPERTQYEAWLIDDDNELSRSLGVLTQNGSGKFSLTFVDPQGQNLLGKFNRMEITLEPNPDDSPNSSRNVLYSASIPSGFAGAYPSPHGRHR